MEYKIKKSIASNIKESYSIEGEDAFENIIMTESLEEAVKVCSQKAESGVAVLLSPACASWDMFKSYEERGRMFKEFVHKLAD